MIAATYKLALIKANIQRLQWVYSSSLHRNPRGRLQFSPVVMIDDSKDRAERLLYRCFSKDKIAQLNLHREFASAVERMKTISDAIDLIQLGQQLSNPKSSSSIKLSH
jgi:hypothetical protein